ncbi:msx2-interacting protein isoform X2 [Alosa pseudoharengus]|uniref:msx2-interacting protein isoform X2 n=1 Tax=Alosa pseudoharengus TaxID=34774 RepID=UPI003F8CE7A6
MVRETRHLWVGNLPEHVREEKIVEHFKRYGRVESVKVLRKRGSEGGVAAFVDFVDIKSAQKAHNAVNKMGDRDLRTDYNEPGSVPSAVRGLEDNPPSSSHAREVSGFSRAAVGPVYGPPVSLHGREGRYERRIDGSSDSRERTYEHSPYSHHERGAAFDRPRHYNTDYYRDRAMFSSAVGSSTAASAMASGFDAPEPHFESRMRDPFALSSATRRDPYRDDRGRRVDRTYHHHRRSRSSHSSQSRHPSPQRTTGQTSKNPHSPKRAPVSPSRGPRSQSRSRSSSSDSVSSTSSTGSGSDSNSSSSGGSRARSVQSAATHAPPAPPPLSIDGDEPRRSFGIRVQNLPVRSTDTSLKDGLFHEFKKYGKVTSVQIHGASEERYGLVFFRQQEDQEKALSVSKGKLFFGMMIEVTAWNGPETESENEFRPLDGRIDEFHPKATRTLFIGNLEKTTNYQQLLDVFQRFGEIVDIDIKRVNGVPQYAFVQYSDIASVCKAIKKMDGEYLGANRLKLGFGKSMPTTCVWLDGLSSNITEQYLTRHFCRYGHVVKVVFDRLKGMALILYNNTDFAQAAVRETKGWKIGGNKIKVDFASQESQMAFYRSMQASGQDIRDFYEIPTERREERRPPYHEFPAERAYYENVRTPGLYTDDPRRDYPGRSRDRYSELDHYPSEHYDPRYHEDPREYRDYRDPFEQDMRKYTYIQRERERERERFEADRGRWSPSHQRRPVTPSASPSPSERVPRETERRVYRHSSERSGSCSSLSPPPAQFEKPEKSPVDYKTEGLEREMDSVEMERVAGAERSRRGRRKDKGDKEKGERGKSRRGKMPSPVSHSETDKEASLDANSNKGKASDTDGPEKSRYKGENEPSPSEQMTRLEPQKGERLDAGKGDASDRDGKGRLKKHLKSDLGSEGKDLILESDRLAARKRRFGDPSGKTIRQKRSRMEDEGIQSPEFGSNSTLAKETEDIKALEKETQKREHLKPKVERGTCHYSLKEDQDSSSMSSMRGQGLCSVVRQGEPSDPDDHDSGKNLSGPSVSRRFSHDETLDQENKSTEEYISLDIDLSQSYRKQMEQNRRLRQQQQEPDKLGKPGSPQSLDAEDLEHRSLVHEVGKPPQDVTDNSPSSRNKKQDTFELDMSLKRERVYRSFRPKSEESEWNNTNSPKPQQSSQNTEEEMIDMPHLMTVKDVKEVPKSEETVHPDLELSVKRVHTTQMAKISTHLHGSVDDAHKRWENRLKQDLLPDLSFSGRKRLGHKHLEYGLWHDLEPGEVRSDSEEDREHKSNSPMPSTSLSLPERQRGDRLSESKLSTSLERNKFYSFALDQTITPDTKALLERAKSLSSSREDNWSFLDYDSHFASFRSRKDTEKVEATPRPTPSWYMKKKKIRSESEDKLDDRKEDPKPEEQERRELFASRFLHSSIFEQDSRRLQHLERKHEDSEQSIGYQSTQQGAVEGQADSEPVVLFHSRFLELTRLQHKNVKELKEPQQEIKREEIVDGSRMDKPQEEESQDQSQPGFQPAIEPALDSETKPVSPIQPVPLAQMAQPAKEMSPPLEKNILQSNSPKSFELSVKEENECEKTPVPPQQQVQEEEQPSISPVLPEPQLTELKEPMNYEQTDPSIKSEKDISEEQISSIESKPSEATETNVELELKPEPEVFNLPSSASPTPVEDTETLKTESCPIDDEPQVKHEVDHTSVDTLSVEEPVSPPQKSKNKKTKASPTMPVAPLASPSSADKQATRKSERIDREKLKRASSPRGEKTAPDSKVSGKSPVQGPEMEQVTEQRRRRRNVKSVYATPVEDESTTQPSKEVEPPRATRKRGGDKEVGQSQQSEQDILAVPITSRRGRPPKNRSKGEDASALKSKIAETKEIEGTELGNSENVLKTSKGKHSPHSQKQQTSQAPASSTSSKKGDKPSDTSQQADLSEDINVPDSATQSDFVSPGEGEKTTENPKPSIEEGQQKDNVVTDRATGNKIDKSTEPPVVEESPQAEKSGGRSKAARLIRNTKLPTEDKSLVLKNLRIRLDMTEVKAMLQSGEEDIEMEELNKKTELLPKDEVMESSQENEVTQSDNDEAPSDSIITNPAESLLSREIELEQAVENIAKLTEGPSPQPFKSPTTEAPIPVVPLPVEPEPPTVVEKPANPASEYELAAAIDSITSEDLSCTLPQEPAINTVMESEPAIQPFVTDSKAMEPSLGSAPIQEETGPTGTPRKGAKGRAKTTKRSKTQKPAASRKEFVKDSVAEPDSSQMNVPDPVIDTNAVTENPSATSIVITSPSKLNASLNVSHQTDSVSEEPLNDEPTHGRSAGLVNKSPNILKPPQPYECTPLSPTSLCLKPSHSSKLPLPPTDRFIQSRDTPMVPVAQGENPTVSSGLETHDPDSSNSDLRTILMKPKNIPLSGTNTAPGNMPTHPPRESESPSEMVANKNPQPESRHSYLPAQPVVRSPGSLPSTETKQLFGEKTVISVIASTATSVISRICNTPESEEKANIPRNNPYGEKQLPKQMFQTSMEESSTYHGTTVGDEGGNAGRFVVESATLSTGPSPGLRVNTSEGVVVLSHSGQKMEGPQRISAKISQIPPASPADMESQQLVSMPQMKPDHYAQTPSAKCPLVPSDHGHSHKTQSGVSIKQENSLDKMETYQAGGQSGVVKRLQQSGGNQQVMNYHHSDFPMLMKHPKKAEGAEPLSDGAKPSWASAISPAISPHLPSSAGNPVGFLPNTPTDRGPSHLSGIKEPRSPRKSGHPHSPFTKVSPIGSSSPKAIPVVLPSGLPPMSQYVPNVHHPEQSVIMPPHSSHGSIGRMSPHRVGQTIPIGHLSQGDVRVNTPPLAMMNYGMHSDPLSSPWSGPPQQCPTSPQAGGGRDMVLKVNPGNTRSHEANEEDTRRYQALGRPAATSLKPETLPQEYRGTLHGGLSLDRYNIAGRDMRVLMHHQQGERPATELHQGPEPVPSSSSATSITASLSPRAHLLSKNVPEKDTLKSSEVNRPLSPVTKEGIIGIRGAMPAIASPQRIQLLSSGTSPAFSEYPAVYTNIRSVPSQFAENSPLNISQAPHIASTQAPQDPDRSQTLNEGKGEQMEHQSVNMVQLLTKYPIIWQGLLALKNDTAAVQLHFVYGNKALAVRSLPLQEGGALLRIVQRMRLEASQLDSVARRMTGDSEFCLLLAMPCGRDQDDVRSQTQFLRTAFINYLQAKLAAGIINIPNPGSNQPAYVLQIFPPCEFSESHLSRLAPDLLSRISSICPQHLMIVITSV